MPEGKASCCYRPRGEAGGEFGEQALGGGRVDFILDCHVRAEGLAVLRRQHVRPCPRKTGAQTGQRFGFEGEGDAAAERLQAGNADGKGGHRGALAGQVGGDVLVLRAG